jgi:hypothetical protein
MYTNINDISKWLNTHRIGSYTVRPTLWGGTPDSQFAPVAWVVDVVGHVELEDYSGTSLPVQFGKVTGIFNVVDSKLTTLEGMPRGIGSWFSCRNCEFKSLSGIDKRVDYINGEVFLNIEMTHILGLLLIDGIRNFTMPDSPESRCLEIMNKHLGTRDILACQDELIDAGFIDQARL